MSAVNVRGNTFKVREDLTEFVNMKIRELVGKHKLGLIWADVVFSTEGEGKKGAEISLKVGDKDYFAKSKGARALTAFTKTLRLVEKQIIVKSAKNKAARRSK